MIKFHRRRNSFVSKTLTWLMVLGMMLSQSFPGYVRVVSAEDGVYAGGVTFGERVSPDFVEGQLDILIPVSRTENGLFFVNPRGSMGDDKEKEFNVGVGYRHLMKDRQLIIGGNVFYDSRWTRYDAQFNQVGVGVEVLSKWVDFRANYYLPEDREELSESEETVEHVGSSTSSTYEQWAEGNSLIERETRTTINSYLHTLYEIYEGTMEGFDAEIGFGIALPWDTIEARVFAGYYNFDPNLDLDNIDGCKLRLEVRALPSVTFDAEIFEDDELFGSEYLVGMRVRLPFDIGNISQGKNPFEGAKSEFRSRKPQFEDRMTEMVIRDPHIQLARETQVSESTTTDALTRRSEYPILTDVIYVDSLVGTPTGIGTMEDPVDTIDRGLNLAGADGTVYVFSGIGYDEQPDITENISLYGEGYRLGTDRGFGGSLWPVVNGEASEYCMFVDEVDSALIGGFMFANSFVGTMALNVNDLTWSENVTQNTGVGLASINDNGESFSLVANENTLNNNGAGIVGVAMNTPGEVTINDNTMMNCVLGSAVGAIGPLAAVDVAMIGNNLYGVEADAQALLDALELPVTLPEGLGIPPVGGLLVGGADAADMRVYIAGNTIANHAVGIGVGVMDAEMDVRITDNAVSGGGAGSLLGIAGEIGMIPSLDYSGLNDLGIAGILGIAIGSDADLDIDILNNNVSGEGIGIAVAEAMGATTEAAIYNNTLVDNSVGVLGVGLSGDYLDLEVYNNSISGGQSSDVVDFALDLIGYTNDLEFGDMGIIGIAGVAVGDDTVVDFDVHNNIVMDSAVGVLAVGVEAGKMNAVVDENMLLGNGVGALGVGYNNYGSTLDIEIANNTITGGEANDIVNFALDFMGYPGDAELGDLGLLGAGMLVMTGDADLYVHDNIIRDNAIGVLAGVVESMDVNIRVEDNMLLDNAAGVVAGVMGPSISPDIDLDVHRNTITGDKVDDIANFALDVFAPGADALNVGNLGVVGIAVVSSQFDALDVDISQNTIQDNAVAILAAGIDGGEVDLVVDNNMLLGNGAGVLGVGMGVDEYNLIAVNNTISGAKIGEVVNFALDFMGATNSLDVGDLGLLGIGAANLGGDLDVIAMGNTITDNALGILAIQSDGDEMDALIFDNEISNAALGIAAAGLYSGDSDIRILQNTVTGGQGGPIVDFALDFLGLPFELGLGDVGLVGVAAFASGDSTDMDLDISLNTVNGAALGILAVDTDTLAMDANINNNIISGSALGIAAVSEAPNDTEYDIINNTVSGAIFGDMLEGIGILPPELGINDVGAVGILGVAWNTDGTIVDFDIEDNTVLHNTIGIAGLSIMEGSADFDIEDNILSGSGNMVGVIAGAFDGSMIEAGIIDNVIQGDGLDELMALPGELGLAGVITFAIGNSTSAVDVVGNEIDDHLLGIAMLSADSGAVDALVLDNELQDNAIGVLGMAMTDSALSTVIALNDIEGGALPGPLAAMLPFGAGVLMTASGNSTIDAELDDNEITGNAGFGVLALSGVDVLDFLTGGPGGGTTGTVVNIDMEDNEITGNGMAGVVYYANDKDNAINSVLDNNIITGNTSFMSIPTPFGTLAPSGVIGLCNGNGTSVDGDTALNVTLTNNVSDSPYIFVYDGAPTNPAGGAVMTITDLGGNTPTGMLGIIEMNLPDADLIPLP